MNQNSPMTGLEANSPGNYELISRTNNTIMNPGEEMIIDILITGYGKITQSKLAFYPSGEILDIEKSFIHFDLRENEKREIVWGANKEKLKNEGVMIGMSGRGWQHENWPNNTMFFDLEYDSPQLKKSTPIISTESIMNSHKPPFQFDLKTNNNISPGNYSLNFTFTYYNGSEWKASQLIVPFTIRNIFQRNENLISWIAFIAASVSIVAAVYTIIDFYKK